MSMSANRGRLMMITKELNSRWVETKESWMDAKSREFEVKYIQELITNVDTAATVIDQLDKLVNKIRNDCE
jgi:hypothetical protein